MYYVVVTTINYDFVVPDVSDLQRQRNIEICDGWNSSQSRERMYDAMTELAPTATTSVAHVVHFHTEFQASTLESETKRISQRMDPSNAYSIEAQEFQGPASPHFLPWRRKNQCISGLPIAALNILGRISYSYRRAFGILRIPHRGWLAITK